MAKWDLMVGDESRTALVATLDGQRLMASGDYLMASILFPFEWEEFLPNGGRQTAWDRAMPVAFTLARPWSTIPVLGPYRTHARYPRGTANAASIAPPHRGNLSHRSGPSRR